MPLKEPYPFGIGKVLSAHADGSLNIQWMGYEGNNFSPHLHKLSLAWIPAKGPNDEPYYADAKQQTADRPYCVSDDYDTTFHQRDVLLHSFALTQARRLPAGVTRALSDHPDVWWTKPKPKPKTRTEPKTKPQPETKPKSTNKPKPNQKRSHSHTDHGQTEPTPRQSKRIRADASKPS